MKRGQFATIDEYIAAAPAELRPIASELRSTIRKAAPGATEKISYGIPTFYQNGNLVHFAVFDKHIGFYPTPSAIEAFRNELTPYNRAKGSVQFPHDQPLPLKLVTRMVQFRVRQNASKKTAAPRNQPRTRAQTR